MVNSDYIAGYEAYWEGLPYDADKPDIWQAGWRDAAEDDSIEHSENARFH